MILHPLMLAWLGGAVVPLVLHLLSRSRYRAVPWGAMMFLSGADAATHHAARLRQWFLLLLRMGTVGLLAVALARPVISARYAKVPTGGLTTGGPAAVVIILDDSASMGYEKDGKSRLDQAREVTLQILSALKRGDQAALLIAGTHDYQQPVPPNSDLQSIAARVADLQPDIGMVDLTNELFRAADLLEHAAPADHEIYVVIDHQALDWRAVNDAFKQRWAARKSSSPPLRVTIFPVGGDESDNVAVDGFDLPDRAIFRDQPTDLQVRVRNFGPAAVENLPLSVWTGARTLGDTTVSVPAHATRAVDIQIRFGEPGSRVISAAVKSTGLTTDDRMDYSVDVLDPPQVLVVSGSSLATQPVSALQSLITATNRRGIDLATATTKPAADLGADSLKGVNVVVLDDVARLSVERLKLLQQFTINGGGVLLIPGDNTARDLKANPIYQGGGALFPAMLQPPVPPARPRLGEIATLDRQNPIFRFLGSRPDPFARIPIRRFFPIRGRGNATHVLARYGSNDPFLLESPMGRGRVLLMTTPVDPLWNALPSANILQPLMQSIIRYLVQGAAVDRNLWPGQAIEAVVDEPVEDRSATVQFSAYGQREPATVARVNDHTELRYAKTGKPGTYRLRYRTGGKEKTLNYVVSAGRSESDLTPLTDEQWHTMADRVGFDRVDLAQSTVAAAIDSRRGGREIWIDLVGGVLGLMMLEMMVSRWWSV